MGLSHLSHRYHHWSDSGDGVMDSRMESTRMTKGVMRQKASVIRREAKALQRNVLSITDPEQRKQLSLQMSASASSEKEQETLNIQAIGR